MSATSPAVALGLRVKTGKAIVVALRTDDRAVAVVLRTEIGLTDPSMPSTFQPHHEVMHLPWDAARRAAEPAVRKIRKAAIKALASLQADLTAQRARPSAAGIVGGSPNDPGRIANPHIRAHAAEGILFREATEFAARECGLVAEAFAERDLRAGAPRRLGLAPAAIDRKLAEFGRSIKPWRADEKLATLSAWMTLRKRADSRSGRPRAGGR